MADETIADENLVQTADSEPEIVEEAPVTAKDRLRAFEDETLGEDAPRISGQIEKGHGSFFKTKLTDGQRAHHAALERLVEAEQKLAHASAALETAGLAHEKAQAAVAASESRVEAEHDGEHAE